MPFQICYKVSSALDHSVIMLPDEYYKFVTDADGVEIANKYFSETKKVPHHQTMRGALIRLAKSRIAKSNRADSLEKQQIEFALADSIERAAKTEKKPAQVIPFELPGIPKKRGRPNTGKALSNADRQKNFRERRAKQEKMRIDSAAESFSSESETELLEWLVKSGPALQEKAWLELGRRKGWKLS